MGKIINIYQDVLFFSIIIHLIDCLGIQFVTSRLELIVSCHAAEDVLSTIIKLFKRGTMLEVGASAIVSKGFRASFDISFRCFVVAINYSQR